MKNCMCKNVLIHHGSTQVTRVQFWVGGFGVRDSVAMGGNGKKWCFSAPIRFIIQRKGKKWADVLAWLPTRPIPPPRRRNDVEAGLPGANHRCPGKPIGAAIEERQRG